MVGLACCQFSFMHYVLRVININTVLQRKFFCMDNLFHG
jgi:hypothetical protein